MLDAVEATASGSMALWAGMQSAARQLDLEGRVPGALLHHRQRKRRGRLHNVQRHRHLNSARRGRHSHGHHHLVCKGGGEGAGGHGGIAPLQLKHALGGLVLQHSGGG